MNSSNTDMSVWVRSLIKIEKLGNRLPSPVVLFLWLILFTLCVSTMAYYFGWSASHPSSGEVMSVKPLLGVDALHWWLSSAVKTFMNFAPVGPVVVVMLGLGIAEHSGFLAAALKRLLTMIPDSALTFGTVLVGVLSSIAVDAGYVVAIPLSGVIYSLAGRSPILGMAACFAGVSGGFSANFLVGPVDVILGGISTEAARLIDPNAEVSAVANYYFIFASVFLISMVATFVTQYVVEPAITNMGIDVNSDPTTSSPEVEKAEVQKAEFDNALSDQESKALKIALSVLVGFTAIIALLVVPEGGVLRHPETGSIIRSPFMSGLIVIIALAAAITGIVYGRITGRYRTSTEVVEGMEQAVKTLAGYLVLMFFAAQFVALFSWSNLGAVAAINGAELLQSLQLPITLNVIMFVLLAAGINLLIGSASAKWAVLAPVFIPLLMLNGISPDITQAAFRVGDSSTNIITPLMPYFSLVVALMQRYQSNIGIGTVLAIMLPYSMAFLLAWSALLGLWVGFEWPLGPTS